jgi:hypothetical protein
VARCSPGRVSGHVCSWRKLPRASADHPFVGPPKLAIHAPRRAWEGRIALRPRAGANAGNRMPTPFPEAQAAIRPKTPTIFAPG